MSTGAAVVVPPSGGSGGSLAGDVSGIFLANVINPGVVTGGPGGKIALITITGGGPGGNIAPTTITSYNIVPGSITPTSLASSAIPFNNLLTNPGFNICQLYDPTIANTIPDNTVAPDGWKLTRQNADAQYRRISNAGMAGYNSAYSGRFTKITALGKMMAYQPLESLITLACASRAIVFTIKLNMSAAHRIRIGFLSHAGATPNEVVPAPIAAWNANGVAPTLNAGFFDLGNFVLNGGAPVGPGTSSWATAFVMPVFTVNDILSVYVLTDDQFAPGDFFDLYEMSLNVGSDGRFTWNPYGEPEDIERCQRFIEKSYDLDTVPGTVTTNGQIYRSFGSTGAGNPITGVEVQRKVRVPLMAEINLFSPSTGAVGNWFNANGAVDFLVAPANEGDKAFGVADTGGATAPTESTQGHYLVNTSL